MMLKTILMVMMTIINSSFLINNNDIHIEKYINNVSENIKYENNEKITVFVEFSYSSFENKKNMTNDLQKNRELIKEKRLENKKYYGKNNKRMIKQLDLFKLGFKNSEYSKFAYKYYSNYSEFQEEEEQLISALNSDLISRIYVDEFLTFNVDKQATVNIEQSSKEITMEEAKEMMGISNTAYTGSQVRIGIVETGYLDDLTNFAAKPIVNLFPNEGVDNSSHSTAVASVAAGINGIATGASIYVGTYNPANDNDFYDGYNSFFDNIETMIDELVDIINISLATDTLESETDGKYNGYSAYLDHIVWENEVCIVVAAGNYRPDKNMQYVINPGLGPNVISVGMIDKDYNVSNISLFDLYETYEIDKKLMKPTLVAPCENIIIPNVYDNEPVRGTSFAAPMVSGIVALLIEQFPMLMGEPQLIMAALVNSCEKLPTQSGRFDEVCGAGLINYTRARQLLSNVNNYGYTWTENVLEPGTTVLTKQVVINEMEGVDFSLVCMADTEKYTPTMEEIEPSFSNYKIEVYEGNALIKSFYTSSNMIVDSFVNPNNTDKTYTFKVVLVGEKVGSHQESIALTFMKFNHYHEYSFLIYNNTFHKKVCTCGNFTLERHTTNSSGVSNGKARCVSCLAIIDTSGGFIEVGSIKDDNVCC